MADVDLGFSEFVAKLVSETFAAVAESILEQERRYAELSAAASLTLEEFLEAFVAEEDVDAGLLALFPPPGDGAAEGSDPRKSSAAGGQPYQPGDADGPETPPLRETLGITIERGDLTAAKRISGRLAHRIRVLVAEEIGRSEWELARAVVQRGVPRVLVDSGHIMAKQTYNLVPAAEVSSPTAPVTGPLSGRPSVLARSAATGPQPPLHHRPLVLGRLLSSSIRPDLTIRVTSPRASEPVSSGNIYGEVQVTFKTVP